MQEVHDWSDIDGDGVFVPAHVVATALEDDVPEESTSGEWAPDLNEAVV